MKFKTAREKNYILFAPNGKALTEDELKFLDIIQTFKEQYGSSILFALEILLKAFINNKNEKRN